MKTFKFDIWWDWTGWSPGLWFSFPGVISGSDVCFVNFHIYPDQCPWSKWREASPNHNATPTMLHCGSALPFRTKAQKYNSDQNTHSFLAWSDCINLRASFRRFCGFRFPSFHQLPSYQPIPQPDWSRIQEMVDTCRSDQKLPEPPVALPVWPEPTRT